MAGVVPANLKAIQTYIRLAKEYDKRDPIVAYFCRMHAVQKGIKIDSKSPDCKSFLIGLMDQLEQVKKDLVAKGDETVSNDIVGQAHVETKTINLFTWADTEDRKGVFNKNITKAFYSASLLFDVLTQFGEQSDECKVMLKYSKWKATYLHKCAQSGETPVPGPEGSGFESDLDGLGDTGSSDFRAGGEQYPVKPAQPGDYSSYQQPQNFPGPSMPNELSSYQQPQNLPGPSTQRDTTPKQQPAVPFTLPSSHLDASQINIPQVTKYCKFAMSSLEYDDVASAVDNITKALNMLTKK